MSKDARLVYSSDPKMNEKCPKCKELKAGCVCIPETDPGAGRILAVLRIEKQGRGGKTVTVIDKLPRNEAFLKDLSSELKKKCGAGGTYILGDPDGKVEIQGDKREQVRALLGQKGISCRG